MQLGLFMGYSGPKFSIDMDLVLEAERLGFDSVWTSEAYGSDAVTPAAWMLAQTSRINVGTGIIQMPARTPACAAMTAMTLQALSGGRFMLGIGPSGPQVIEGWHGVAYGRPLTRTREYIDIIRQALAREAPVTPAAWMLAQTSRINVGTGIIQMPARTPACAAMTAMTLQALSGGRFILGIGPSGPQVIEGWHGVAYGRPLTRTREYIDIIRQALKREAPVTHDGYHYQLPYKGADASGLGKPLKSILHGDPALKIFTAAVAPKGIQLAAENADGMFPIFMSPERFDVFEEDLNAGFVKAGGGKSLKDFEIAPIVPLAMGPSVEMCRQPIRRHLALYIGGMGAPGKNFYNDYAKRLGYEEAALKIQQLYLTGKKKEAEAAVPKELIDAVALVGPAERIKERLTVWKDAAKEGKVSSLLLSGGGSPDAFRFVAEEVL